MAGRIGDLIFRLAGQKDPRDALVAAMAGGDTPDTPAAVGATPGAVGTVPPAAPGMAPGAPPAPDQTPEIYKSPPQLIQLYSDLMKREDLNKGIDRGIGLIGASLAQDQNKNSILATMSDASSNGNDVGGFVNNLLSMRAANTAAATKAAQRASVPAIAKQLGIDDQTALFLFDSGKLDQVVAEAQKPDNQLIQDPDTGQYHIVDKKTGKLSEGIGNPKKREIELIDNPVTGGKTAVYKDTKEPVGSGDVPGAGNTELQKNYNAAMRGLTPDDPGYMTLQEFADKSKNGGQRYLQVGNGKVFDTEEKKFVTDPNDPMNAVADTDPNNAPILAPGQVDTEFLSKLPADTQSIVKGLTDYTLDLSKVSSIKGDARQKLAAAAKRYDPSFDMSQYAARSKMRQSMTSGSYSQAINSSNLVIQHLHKLAEIAKTMDNSSYPLFNWGKNVVSQQTGDDEITNFKTARAAAAAELAKVFKGTGASSLTEIKDWEDNLDPSASPKQIQTSIKTLVKDLLGSRLDTIRQQYSSAMGKPADFRILTPKSEQILKDLGVDPTELGEEAEPDTTDTPEDKGTRDEEPSIDDLVKKHLKK